MIIYPAEEKAGLSHLLSNASIKCFSQAVSILNADTEDVLEKNSQADSVKFDDDLFFVESILVTADWNKNDDYFDKNEVWNSRHTPLHKPSDVEHNRANIVGHITHCWGVDVDGNKLEDGLKSVDLPDFYHLMVGSVIYKNTLTAEEKKTTEFIDAIKKGEWYVSMECLFTNFDYIALNASNQLVRIPRTAETAFLTKHLRAYQGTGSYENYKIGRLPKNIMFSGKGFVKNPANENGLIFTKAHKFNKFIESGVNNITELLSAKMENEMPVDFEVQYNELKKTVERLEAQNKELSDKMIKSNVDKLSAEIVELTASIESANKSIADLKTENKNYTTQIATLTEQVTVATKAKTDLETELTSVKADILKANRVSKLVSDGLTKEEADSLVAKFTSLSDEQFTAIAELAVKANKPVEKLADKKEPNKASKDDEEDENEENADSDVEDTEEAAEAALSGADTSGDEEISDVRMALASVIADRLGIKLPNKGE